MITKIKKQVGDILTSPFFYNLLVKKSISNGLMKTGKGFISVKDQAPYLQSLIYWNLYERSEVKLISTYLRPGMPVIEFGASLGMTSSSICSKVEKTVPVFSVEANQKLFYNLNETKKKNHFDNLTLIWAAVDYSGVSHIDFMIDDSNLGSHKGSSSNSVSVPTITMGEIVTKNQIKSFSLVCDIEGAELEMFLLENNPDVINGCMQIIIELHPTEYQGKKYSQHDISAIITDRFKMRTVYSDGKTWVFEKSAGAE